MDQFNQAAQLNSQGVNALLDGNDDDAATSFTECVKMFKSVLSTPEVYPATEVGPNQSPPVQPQSNAIGDMTVQLPNIIVNGHQLQDSIFFNQAVKIPTSCSESLPVEQYIYVCAAAAAFNLAIAHHRKGKKMGLAACTAKAEKLYSMVLKLLHDDSNNKITVIGVLVKLASINNLLDIRFESGNYDLAKDGFSQVSNMLRSFYPSHHDLVIDTPSFQETEVKSLLKNILLLRPPRVAPAA